MSGVREPDWAHWLKQWDRQQQNSFPAREVRFNSILDVLGARMRRKFTVLDLGCGPGSLSLRGLRRFPKARFIGVDADPVMLKLGRESVGSVGGRMRWVSADIRRSDWVTKLPVRRVDAAISTNALHWLPPPKLRRLYRDIHALLSPRGVFLNGDWLTSKDEGPTLQHLFHRIYRERRQRIHKPAMWLDWSGWWRQLEREPALENLFAMRRKIFPRRHPREPHLSVEDHLNALRRAGFEGVGVVQQDLEDRILIAVK